MSDTQNIRNAYLSRSSEQIGRSFGDFACEYLGVNDPWLAREANVNAACNYILSVGYEIPVQNSEYVKEAIATRNSQRQAWASSGYSA